MSSLQMFQKHGAGYNRKQSSSSTSSASLNEVCSSTASMSVSSRPYHNSYDSPTVVSFSSSSAPSIANNSEQFEDADEFQPLKAPQREASNPLNALAMAACASPAVKTRPTGVALSDVGAWDNDISDNDVLCGRGGLTNHRKYIFLLSVNIYLLHIIMYTFTNRFMPSLSPYFFSTQTQEMFDSAAWCE